jgi:hypothetical protein
MGSAEKILDLSGCAARILKHSPTARSAALAKILPARLGLRATGRGDAWCELVLSAYPSKSSALSTMSLFPASDDVGFIEFR